ncbi:MAG: hypothetical protein ACYDBB_22375 [Armatimonadota bacterium]
MLTFANDTLCLTIEDGAGYHLESIALRTPDGWTTLAQGIAGQEFSTSLGGANAVSCAVESGDGTVVLRLNGHGDGWDAEETITLHADPPSVRREQTYRFTHDCQGAVHPGCRVATDAEIRYTYPLNAYDQPIAGVPPLRAPVDWALPLPCHIWHTGQWVAIYGIDRSVSAGTLDFQPSDQGTSAILRAYYPDSGEPGPEPFCIPLQPTEAQFQAGDSLTLTEVWAAALLQAGDDALFEAERLAAAILLRQPAPPADLEAVADGVAEFYRHCELWNPDALGEGRGWFSNMWVFTQSGTPAKSGWMSGYFDFGWGEGIAVEAMLGIIRHWRRTGCADLLPYVDEMSRNIPLFQRAPGDDQPYFDRSDGTRFGDFLMDHVPGSRIWTHSLGHTGSQLLQLYLENPNYPNPVAREEWITAAGSIARFFARQQQPDGDLCDIFDDGDGEVNRKPHRITARVVVCGLWTLFAQVTGDTTYLDRALRLAKAVGPEIERFEFYNQMIDGIYAPEAEYIDGEAAYYALEGVAPLYAATRDPFVLNLCRKAAAYGISWTYFYDVPQAHRGIARGGQCCRMPDFPLLYPIGPAKAITPLLWLYDATGDAFFRRMAEEMVTFLGHYRMDAPGKPWDGGMIHAIGQYCGKHWGPDLGGQIDSGMATGNSLAAIEYWLAREARG